MVKMAVKTAQIRLIPAAMQVVMPQETLLLIKAVPIKEIPIKITLPQAQITLAVR